MVLRPTRVGNRFRMVRPSNRLRTVHPNNLLHLTGNSKVGQVLTLIRLKARLTPVRDLNINRRII
jgi:hypothetical protein